MGLILGFGLTGAFVGGGLAFVCFEEARRLQRLDHRFPAACFAVGAAFCAAAALGGAWLAWSIIDGFLL